MSITDIATRGFGPGERFAVRGFSAAVAAVTATVLASNVVLVEWDLDDAGDWNTTEVRLYPDGAPELAEVIHDDLPNESDTPRRQHAAGGDDEWNPALDVKNHYRHTTALANGDWVFSVRFSRRVAGVLEDAGDWMAADAVTVAAAPVTFATLGVHLGYADPAPAPFTSRLGCTHLIGSTLTNSEQGVDQLSVSFGSAGSRFGGAGGDWATYRTNEVDPIVDFSSDIFQLFSRPWGTRLVPEDGFGDTNTDQRAIGRRIDGVWGQNGMTTPLECVEAGMDGVLLDDWIATMAALAGEGIACCCHYGAPLQNSTHTDAALDGVELLSTVVGGRTHLMLDSHQGAFDTDDRTGLPTITARIVERMGELGLRVALEGVLLRSRSEHWLSYDNVDWLVGFDSLFNSINAGGSPSTPLTGGSIESDPDPTRIQPADNPNQRFFTLLDSSNSAAMAAAVGNEAKRDVALDITLAAFDFAPNLHVSIGSPVIFKLFTQPQIDAMLNAGGMGLGPAASLTIRGPRTRGVQLAGPRTRGVQLAGPRTRRVWSR